MTRLWPIERTLYQYPSRYQYLDLVTRQNTLEGGGHLLMSIAEIPADSEIGQKWVGLKYTCLPPPLF